MVWGGGGARGLGDHGLLKEETEQRVRANGQRVAPLCSLLSLGRKILCVVTNGDVDVDVVCVVWCSSNVNIRF